MEAISLFQTLYFTFTGHPESVELFPRLRVEPWGRVRTGVIALMAVILLLLAATIFIGTSPRIGLMPGVILSHLTIDIESKGDEGQPFMLAIAVWVCCAIIMLMYKHQEIALFKKIRKSQSNIVFK